MQQKVAGTIGKCAPDGEVTSTVAATLRSLERAESWLEKRRRRPALGAAGLTQVGPEEDEQSDSGDDIQEDVESDDFEDQRPDNRSDHQDDVSDGVSDMSDRSEQPEERDYFDDVRFDNCQFVMHSARSSPTRDSSGYSAIRMGEPTLQMPTLQGADKFGDGGTTGFVLSGNSGNRHRVREESPGILAKRMKFTDDWVNPFILVFNSNCPVDITFVSSMLEQLGVPPNELENQLKCESASIGVSKILKGIMRKDQTSPFILLPPTAERSVATLMMNLKRIVDVLFDNILIKENRFILKFNKDTKCYDLMALIEHFPQQTIKAFKMLNKNTKKDVKSYAHRLGCPLDKINTV